MSDTDPQPDPEHPLLVLARRGFDDVHSDPRRADDALRRVIDDPNAPERARMIALWGAGRMHHDAGRPGDAVLAYREAMALARAGGFAEDESQITLSLSSALVLSGDHAAALAGLDEIAGSVDGAVLGRLLTQRAYVLGSLGQIERAEADAGRALALLREHGDVVGEIRLRINRGAMLLPLGRTAQVRDDLETALALAQRDDQKVLGSRGGAQPRLSRLPARVDCRAHCAPTRWLGSDMPRSVRPGGSTPSWTWTSAGSCSRPASRTRR